VGYTFVTGAINLQSQNKACGKAFCLQAENAWHV